MAVDNTFVIKKLQELDEFFTVYSMGTRLPYVYCDPETFDDQIFLFASEEDAKKFIVEKLQQKIQLQLTKVPKDSMMMFYTNLHLIGVNCLVFTLNGMSTPLPIEKVVVVPNLAQEAGKPPKANPTLMLTMIYYLQELRSVVSREKRDDEAYTARLREMEQEVIMNLSRSNFILLMDVSDVEEGKDLRSQADKIKFPYLKDKQGKVLQPVFTDLFEFQKFASTLKGKINLLTVTFDKLEKSMLRSAAGYALNPGSINMIISRDKLKLMYEMTADENQSGNGEA